MKEAVKKFIEITEKMKSNSMAIADDDFYSLGQRLEYDYRWDALNDIIDSVEFQALKSLVEDSAENEKKKMTLVEIAKCEYPSYGFRVPTTEQWFKCLSKYLEKEGC